MFSLLPFCYFSEENNLLGLGKTLFYFIFKTSDVFGDVSVRAVWSCVQSGNKTSCSYNHSLAVMVEVNTSSIYILCNYSIRFHKVNRHCEVNVSWPLKLEIVTMTVKYISLVWYASLSTAVSVYWIVQNGNTWQVFSCWTHVLHSVVSLNRPLKN